LERSELKGEMRQKNFMKNYAFWQLVVKTFSIPRFDIKFVDTFSLYIKFIVTLNLFHYCVTYLFMYSKLSIIPFIEGSCNLWEGGINIQDQIGQKFKFKCFFSFLSIHN